MIEFERRRERSLGVELTPLIDVVFQLLVFFLLTSALMAQAIPVNLPKAATGDELQQVVKVTLDQKGKLYLDDERTQRDDLRAGVKKVIRGFNPSEVRAVIAALKSKVTTTREREPRNVANANEDEYVYGIPPRRGSLQ